MAKKRSSRELRKPVTFAVDAPDAKDVVVTGDFTQWAVDRLRLARGDDGLWRGSLLLPPGEYQYRLRIDGLWRDPPDAVRRVPNPFGTENAVLTVS